MALKLQRGQESCLCPSADGPSLSAELPGAAFACEGPAGLPVPCRGPADATGLEVLPQLPAERWLGLLEQPGPGGEAAAG